MRSVYGVRGNNSRWSLVCGCGHAQDRRFLTQSHAPPRGGVESEILSGASRSRSRSRVLSTREECIYGGLRNDSRWSLVCGCGHAQDRRFLTQSHAPPRGGVESEILSGASRSRSRVLSTREECIYGGLRNDSRWSLVCGCGHAQDRRFLTQSHAPPRGGVESEILSGASRSSP